MKKEASSLEEFIRMEKITKYFDDYAVLDNVDFSAGQGQVHALIGENGAGKTTLMKILAGLYPPDKGSIFLGGRPFRFIIRKERRN